MTATPASMTRASSRMSTWEFYDITIPRGMTLGQARALLVEQAELHQWELARTRVMRDGRRLVRLRRRVIRVQRTSQA